jgi:hypothetical protein
VIGGHMLPLSTLLARIDVADRRYWLSNCEGFHVRSGFRRLGIVESVRHGSDPRLPETIHVRAGIVHMREIAIRVDDVEGLDLRRHTIWVRTADAAGPRARRRDGWFRHAGTVTRTAQRAAAGGAR